MNGFRCCQEQRILSFYLWKLTLFPEEAGELMKKIEFVIGLLVLASGAIELLPIEYDES